MPKTLDTLSSEEGSSQDTNLGYLESPNIDHFYKDFRDDLFKALNNYWVSRTLFTLGLISSYLLGPFLVGFVLLLEILIKNPQPIYPRNVLVKGYKFLFSLRQKPFRQVKKKE